MMIKLPNFSSKPTARNGFTMIELLVVTTIIIVLTTIGLVSYQRAGQNARNGKRKADLETVRQSLVLYRTDQGEYPAGNGSAIAFDNMISDLTGYLSVTALSDPTDTTPFVYTYESDAVDFEICTYLEPSPGTQYCVVNP